jgi:hypothetical protein
MSEWQPKMAAEATTHFRWLVRITYRTEAGLIDVDHHVEEILEAHNLVEGGPDWNTIEKVEIRLNPKRSAFPGDTVEKAAQR